MWFLGTNHFWNQSERASLLSASPTRLNYCTLFCGFMSLLIWPAVFLSVHSSLSGGQTPFSSFRGFETSLATGAWKAGDLGVTRQRMARVWKGFTPWAGAEGSGVQWRGPCWHSRTPFYLSCRPPRVPLSPPAFTPWGLRGRAWELLGAVCQLSCGPWTGRTQIISTVAICGKPPSHFFIYFSWWKKPQQQRTSVHFYFTDLLLVQKPFWKIYYLVPLLVLLFSATEENLRPVPK